MITIFSLICVALTIANFLAYRIGYEHGTTHASDDNAFFSALALDNARSEGYESGYAEGYEAGYAEGHEAGRAEGYKQGQTQGFNDGRAYAEIAQHNAQIIDRHHGRVYDHKRKEVKP